MISLLSGPHVVGTLGFHGCLSGCVLTVYSCHLLKESCCANCSISVMNSKIVRGEIAKLSRKRRGSFEQIQKVLKPPPPVSELLVELASLKLQTHDFFMKERGLCGLGLNPKLPSDMACVTSENIEEVWRKCSSFKTSNTNLKLESRLDLLQLYAKIYGKPEVTNNEFMVWVVKGYIAKSLDLEVDWATAAASTTQILASRLEGELPKWELTSKEVAELHRLAPWVVAKQSGFHSKSSSLGSTPVDVKWCPPRS
jgi:hypothetical protein